MEEKILFRKMVINLLIQLIILPLVGYSSDNFYNHVMYKFLTIALGLACIVVMVNQFTIARKINKIDKEREGKNG